MRYSMLVTMAVALIVGDANSAVSGWEIDDAETEFSCFNCTMCSDDKSHYDWVDPDGEEYNHWEGGDMHTTCRYIYSECFETHTLCEPMNDETPDDLPLTFASISSLEARLMKAADDREIIQMLASADNWATWDPNSRVVEIRDCEGTLVANIPVQHAVVEQ